MSISLGNYNWRAIFDNQTVLDQFNDSGVEVSVDRIREMPGQLTNIIMIPHREGFPLVALEVSKDDEWVKKWINIIYVDGRQNEVVDCIGLKTQGAEKWVFTYIYNDGTLKTTSNPEP